MNETCVYCHNGFHDNDRVIFSHRETFVFKPADVPDTINPAAATPAELAESRKDFQRTTVVNTFVDWGKASIPADAFSFRHQWCEPQRTGATGAIHHVNKHAIRFNRTTLRGRVSGGQR